jgi:hypothetical protein
MGYDVVTATVSARPSDSGCSGGDDLGRAPGGVEGVYGPHDPDPAKVETEVSYLLA